MENRTRKRMTFKQVEQGYDTQEVDHYIDLLSTRYELLHDKHKQLEAEHQRLIASRASSSSPLAGGVLLPDGEQTMLSSSGGIDDALLEVSAGEAELLARSTSSESLSQPTFAPLPASVPEEPASEAGERGWLSHTAGVLFYLLLAVLVFAVLAYALSDNHHNSFFGYHWYWTQSGSMEPVLPIGSLVIVRAVDPHDLQVGDDATFRTMENGELEFVTHRIIDTPPLKEDEDVTFVTQGIANPDRDPGVRFGEDVVGKVVARVPYLGSAFAWLRENIVMVGAVVLILLVVYLITRRSLRSGA